MTSSSPGTHRPLALIVGDDVETREMYALYLSYEGLNVVEARDGQQAIDRAMHFLPDVITADLGLPAEPALDVCHRLKDREPTRNIPIIAVAGHTDDALLAAAARAGCATVLIKPCTPDVLLAEIYRVLHHPLAAH